MRYYTSDLHLGHKNILLFRKSFSSVEEMDRVLLTNINRRVGTKDELYILGDFTLYTKSNKVKEYRHLISCPNVYLIRGNHDYFLKKRGTVDLFEGVHDYKEIHDGGRKVILSHYPILYWNGDEKGALHLYGHMHARKERQHPREGLNAFNVGVDVRNFMPVTLEELLNGR